MIVAPLVRTIGALGAVIALCSMTACAPAPPEPSAAVMRETSPPWDAPRDAISYIRAAGLEELSSGYSVGESLIATLTVTVDGEQVDVPAYIGIDRLRAVEAPLHTHDASGTVWAEHPRELPTLTLGDFFDLWGVRFTDECLGDACGDVSVTIDGDAVRTDDLRDIPWSPDAAVVVAARR
jgi:hypothetical protein